MKKIAASLLFFFVSSFAVTAKDIVHPFYLLNSKEYQLQLLSGYYIEEHEYEKAKRVQDIFEYKHFAYEVQGIIGLPGQRQVGVNVSFLNNGKLYKEYSPALNIPTQSVQYKGFHALEIYFQEHFLTSNDKNKMALELRVKGAPFDGKETNNTYSGKDIGIAFLYSHDHDQWRIYGNLLSKVIGRKKVRKSNGELEVVNPYSQFGNLLGVQWLNDKFWLEANGLFYLTTDYNSSSPSYTRLTDKGFVIGGKILVGVYLTSASYLTLQHVRSGSNFNVISESTTEANEFEIEAQYSQLGVTWLF